jgi:hypothetical protein
MGLPIKVPELQFIFMGYWKFKSFLRETCGVGGFSISHAGSFP